MRNLKRTGIAVGMLASVALFAGCAGEADAADYVAYEPTVAEAVVEPEPETVDAEIEESEDYYAVAVAEYETAAFEYLETWQDQEYGDFTIRRITPIDWLELPNFVFGNLNNIQGGDALAVFVPPVDSHEDVIWIQAHFLPKSDADFEAGALIHPNPIEEGYMWMINVQGGTEGAGEVLWEIRGEGIRSVDSILFYGNLGSGFVLADNFGIRQ